MKFGDLTSVAHNLATSVSDGVSFLFGSYSIDIHGEATASPEGRVVVDLLTGSVIEGQVSDQLRDLLAKSPKALATLALRHAALPSDFKVLRASYGVDQVHGPHFTVVVEDHEGRRSEERYQGISGRRLHRGHRGTRSARP